MNDHLELIKRLREESGAGVLHCRQALEQHNGDFAAALNALVEKNLARAKGSAAPTYAGRIESYSHANGHLVVMVEVNCETDFAAQSQVFCNFTHELALQIAAAAPQWIDDKDIPAPVLQKITTEAVNKMRAEGKPAALVDQIAAGVVNKFKDRHVLLRQTSIRSETVNVAQMLAHTSASLGERVVIQRFIRWQLGADGETEAL